MPIATTRPHPHLPIPLGQLSPWQESTRDHPLLNAGKDEPLPDSADVVIVGSGMCGAVVAHSLLNSPNRPGSIAVLEAREICSGASGRNAGHCRPDAARGFTAFSGLHGPDQAKHILASETDVFNRVDAFVKKHGIECEWTPRPTYDVCLTDEFKEYEAEALRGLREAGGEPDQYTILNEDSAQKETRVRSAIGAYKWPAGTLNPAQLTLAIHQQNVSSGGYSLFAWTPVHSVTASVRNTDGAGVWLVNTPRGSITASKVVFCTNAYSQAVVPELDGLIVPWRAQAVKLPPAPLGPEVFPRLEPSFSMRYAVHNFYSVAPRPDNSIVLGTSRQWSGMSDATRQKIINTVDDSGPFDEVTRNALEAWGKLYPEGGWDTRLEAKGTREGHEYAWTGIIGMTPDAVPFIGDVPGKAGQYVAAGYNGHGESPFPSICKLKTGRGMARIFLCAPALAAYMQTGKWDAAMPSSFIVSPERIARLRQKVGMSPGESTAEGLAKMIG